MAEFTVEDKERFPLRTTDAVVALFRDHLERRAEPNLALLSIVLGALENTLTANRQATKQRNDERATAAPKPPESSTEVGVAGTDPAVKDTPNVPASESNVTTRHRNTQPLPALQLSMVEALYEKFVTVVKGSVDLSCHTEKYTTVALLKKISDVIWFALTRTFYKDRAHLQTIFSLLTESKLDCFGMAVGVIAACQALGLNDVHLVLSEDHAWAVFGDPASPQSAEITWHGKGSEDRRGQPVICNSAEKSWLYLTPVVCTRHMEVAAMVTAINPAINSSADSLDMSVLQQKLLWVLYDLGHLDKYPASLATLADMEEVIATAGRPPSLTLYMKAIESAKQYYDDSHIYPYTYIGNYYYRRRNYKEALHSWAEAARVISRFNYNRDDEEVYKEFLEIANEMIPNVMRLSSSDQSMGAAAATIVHESEASTNPVIPLTSDPECYAYLLQFYDGLCEWEEGSSTPVLHITWATHALYSLNRFDAIARTHLSIKNAVVGDDETSSKSEEGGPSAAIRGGTKSKRSLDGSGETSHRSRGRPASKRISLSATASSATAVDDTDSSSTTTECGEVQEKRSMADSEEDSNDSSSIQRGRDHNRQDVAAGIDSDKTEMMTDDEKPGAADKGDRIVALLGGVQISKSHGAILVLRSEKMMAMKDLLGAERLNSGAIKLQLTAQSQVHIRQSRISADQATSALMPVTDTSTAAGTRKRIRRE